MKAKSLFSLAMAGLLLGACSNDDVVVSEGNNGAAGTTSPDAGYVALKINLPTVSGMVRANDSFDDGLEAEYEVKNASLFVFEKADDETEAQATLLKAYDISDLKPWEGVNNNVTTYANMVQEVPALKTDTEKRYALVVLNSNSLFTIATDGSVTLAKSASGTPGVKVSTFNDLLTALQMNITDMTSAGFYMANAPVTTEAAGVPTTLVPIEDNIEPTAAQAEANPAANIYVERGMAKVTLSSNTNVEKNVTGTAYVNDKVTITAWGLDITNKSSKMVRDVRGIEWDSYKDASGSSRFYGSVPNPYRSYWGTDGNYTFTVAGADNDGSVLTDEQLTAVKDSFNVITNADVTFAQFGSEAPQYCLENTFSIAGQTQPGSTRVVFKAKYVPGDGSGGTNADADGTFYQLGTTAGIYTTENLKKRIQQAIMEVPSLGASVGIFNVTDNDVKVTLPTEISGGVDGGVYTMANETEAARGTVTFTLYEVKSEDNWIKVSKSTYDDESVAENKRSTEKTFDNDELALIDGNIGVIKYFKAGVSYYSAVIKHFGDDQTTWDPETMDSYTDKEHTGRYGVLRNNWYELSVTSISSPGSPSVPSINDELDDPKESFISLQVNILAWAKRAQNVEL